MWGTRGSRIERGLNWAKKHIERVEPKQFEPALKALLILLSLFAVFHLNELANFTLSIDDEFAAFRDAAVWLSQGRWTTYLFERFVLPQPVLPFLPLALFGLFCSIGYLLFLRAIGIPRPDPLSFAVFPIFAAFPTWAFQTAFQGNTPAAGLGILFSGWAVFLFRKSRERLACVGSRFHEVWHVGIAGLIAAAAIACYQSFFLFIAVTLVASIISMSLAGRPARLLLRDCLAALAVLAVSLVLYTLILKLLLVLCQTSVISYIQAFVQPEALLERFPFRLPISRIGEICCAF